MSQEHVFPAWQADLFPDLQEVDYIRAFQSSTGEGSSQSWPGKPFGVTVGDFCEKCNTGWMSDLEDEAKPVLAPLIQDEPGPLTILEQELITRWTTKTVLAVGPTNAGGRQVASDEVYRWFGAKRMPLPSSIAWVGRYDGTGQFPISFHQHGIVFAPEDGPAPNREDGDPTNAFHAVYAIGHLALFLFSHELPDGPMATGGSDATRTLIWPTQAAVHWPPPKSLGEADLKEGTRQVPGGTAPPLPG
jgi:hypothetical protein